MKTRGLYLFVEDLQRAQTFYALVGLTIEPVSEFLARGFIDNQLIIELGTDDLTSYYDPKYTGIPKGSKGTLNFEFESNDEVDEKHQRMIDAGFSGYLAPFDAPWGARFAIVLDPDGNQVGLNGPRQLKQERQAENKGD